MNALEWLNLSPGWNEFSIRLSLTLLHSIWQGIVMVAIAAVALRCLRRVHQPTVATSWQGSRYFAFPLRPR